MKIKKYTVSDMQEAMSEIKNDLGPDAVIVSSEKAPRKNVKEFFGPRKLTVTAAMEEQKDYFLPEEQHREQISNNTMEEQHMESKKRMPAAALVERTQQHKNNYKSKNVSRSETNKEPVISRSLLPSRLPEPLLETEESSKDDWFKSIVHNLINQQEGMSMSSPIERIKNLLREMEVHDNVIDSLWEGIEDTYGSETGVYDQTEDFLQLMLKNNVVKLLKSAYKDTNDCKIKTFIGPTGVGKTATLVKLATLNKVFYEKEIALIALYDHRFGSLEDMNYYAEIIGVPVEIVMTPGELEKAIEKHSDKDYIFIDTEGRPSKNSGQVLELRTFLDAAGKDQNIMLCLSATTKDRDLMRVARDFRRAGFTEIVFTKLDETDTIGSMLNLMCEMGCPVTYVTSGQSIPDDIEKINAKRAASLLDERFDRYERGEF
ncbi:MAG: flagellar biosynthesis protein FlhF [Clostridiales bacterium]|nr:flagellar biosynthesis protein FlhF [Clostridiales bacterium]MCF8021705.1 flagellar biosynthesis protein FlhF [Clostridiales bacterium]